MFHGTKAPRWAWRIRPLTLPCILISILALAGCGHDAPPAEIPPVQSLLEQWATVQIDSPTPAAPEPARAEVRFDGTGLEARWSVIDGVAEARLEEGVLRGRTTSAQPALLLEWPTPVGVGDELWSVELRLRVSEGSRAAVHPLSDHGPGAEVAVRRIDDWPISSPIVAGDDPVTYTVKLDDVFLLEMPPATTDIHRLLLRPTDVEGADFAVESLRLIFRKEHLASIPSGPGWHGLGEVFRETVVSRAPETLRFAVTLPAKPWLDLAVGSIDAEPPGFHLAVARSGGEATTLAELTVESPETWQSHRLDLAPWAGETVELLLEARSEHPGALAFWGAPTVRSSHVDDERPQAVIVFLADTLRADHLDAWGYERATAPTLKRLAEGGTRFANTFSQATWTKASVPSILTSLYPSTSGVIDFNDRVPAAETTLAEAFRAAGYATFATSSVPFTGQLTRLHQGVEVLYELGALGDRTRGFQSKSAEHWVDRFIAWLDHHHDVPVFAFIHVMDPHSPFRPKPPHDTLWADEAAAERFAAQAEKLEPHIKSPLLRRFVAPSRQELAAAGVDEASFVATEKAWYDGSIHGLDAQLARLVERLEHHQLSERTVLAFVSDHGEEFLEHDRHWHGQTVYGEVTRVPLVLWGRGVSAGQVIEETVQALDLMPTLLDLAGLEKPERLQGRSLVPLWTREGDSGRSRPAFSEHHDHGESGDIASFAIVDEGFKLVWHVGAVPEVAEFELFAVSADPLDQHDVAAEHPEVVERLAVKLRRWREWSVGQRLDPEAANSDLSAAELEQLRSLGYLD